MKKTMPAIAAVALFSATACFAAARWIGSVTTAEALEGYAFLGILAGIACSLWIMGWRLRPVPTLVAGVLVFLTVWGSAAFELAHRHRREEIQAQARLEELSRQALRGEVTVVRANRALPAFVRIPESAIRTEVIPKDSAPPGSRLLAWEVADSFTTVPIAKDEIIDSNRLNRGTRSAASYLAEGQVLFSFRLEGIHCVSGFVKQGDRVDLLGLSSSQSGSSCRTILQNLEVFAVDNYHLEMSPEERNKGDLNSHSMTLKLSEEQVFELVRCYYVERISMSLRPSADDAMAQTAVTNRAITR